METSELIKQVKLRHVIWSATHKDNKKMAAAWHQICKMAWPDFDKRPHDEKRIKCLELQKKWKGLQQSFTRDRLRHNQGRERGVPRNQYYNQLSFLIPTINTKCNGGSSRAEAPCMGASPSPPGPSRVETSSMDVTPSPGPSTSTASITPIPAEEDRQFLMSLVSFMQDVPRSSKLALRSEILQIIAKYTGDSAPECQAPPMSQEY